MPERVIRPSQHLFLPTARTHVEEPIQIAIGIITYRRPKSLTRLFQSLGAEDLADCNGFQFRVLVVDNDPAFPPKISLENLEGHVPFPVHLIEEERRGIPFARQAVVDHLEDSDAALVFIDDDEIADEEWLGNLVQVWRDTGAEIVTGPVHAVLPEDAPAWGHKSRTFDSWKTYRTGTEVGKAYTNNVLVDRKVLQKVQPAFDTDFRYTGSSDIHFFRRARSMGFRIVWCQEALVHEFVPASRLTLKWILRRGFRNGSGDTISRLKNRRSVGTVLQVLVLAAARFGAGIGSITLGSLVSGWPQLIKGIRRVASSVGTLFGLWKVNHNEYLVVHGE